MSNTDNRPITELVSGLVSDISSLFRKEIALAKAETSEKLNRAMGGVEMLAIGAVFAIGAVGVLLSALVTGLGALFVAQGMTEPNANSLAAVIVGVIVAFVAWRLMASGLNTLRGSELSLDRTSSSLQRDAKIVKERL